MVEFTVLYDEVKNLRSADGVGQKNITLSRSAKVRGKRLIKQLKSFMPKNRNDWDFSFLVEFLIALMDTNLGLLKREVETKSKSILDSVTENMGIIDDTMEAKE